MTAAPPPPLPPRPSSTATQRSWRLYASVSEWFLGTLGLGAIGWWLDGRHGSFPLWTLILGGLGLVAGFANLIRNGMRAFRQETRLEGQADGPAAEHGSDPPRK